MKSFLVHLGDMLIYFSNFQRKNQARHHCVPHVLFNKNNIQLSKVHRIISCLKEAKYHRHLTLEMADLHWCLMIRE
uniref:Uncharacterized protein n=1 Tax=Arundo donax TaxID=35708 RepID=A0A0A9DY35_ARUDO